VHTCPNCGEKGITFIGKLLSHPLYPAVCKQCGGGATKTAGVIWTQLFLAIGFLATVPNFLSAGNTAKLGIVAAIVVIAVGQFGPMNRHDL
jgi:hypothetical protein